LAALAVLAPPCRAAKTAEPGQETVWDEIMRAQSVREMRSGAEQMDGKQYDRAAKEFAKAVLARPDDPSPHLMLGAAYYWNNQVDSAEAEFREALRLDPKNAQGHLLMGIVHAYKGDVQSAYKSFLDAEKYGSPRSDVEMNLGSTEETLALYPQALDHLRKAAGLDPEHPLYRFQLGLLYKRLGRDADASQSFKEALNLYPDFEDALLEMGAAEERQGRAREAQSLFAKAVSLKPLDSVARLRLGRSLLLLGKDDRAREVLRDAFHVTPDKSGGGLALSASFGGRPAASSNDEHPSAPPSDSSKAPNDPLDMVARNLERIPLDQDATLNVRMAFIPRSKLERAAPEEGASLKKALEEAGKPAKPTAIGVEREYKFRASDGALREEQIQKAIADLKEAMKNAPPDAEVRLGMQLNYVPRSGGAARARADSENAPKVSYQPRQVGNDLGLWVVGTGWMALVEEVLPEPQEPPRHPGGALWWVADGLGYATLGDGPRALAAFDKALELDPKEETALLGRAVGFVETGREAEAVEAYRRLLALYPKDKIARDGLAWLLRSPSVPKSK